MSYFAFILGLAIGLANHKNFSQFLYNWDRRHVELVRISDEKEQQRKKKKREKDQLFEQHYLRTIRN